MFPVVNSIFLVSYFLSFFLFCYSFLFLLFFLHCTHPILFLPSFPSYLILSSSVSSTYRSAMDGSPSVGAPIGSARSRQRGMACLRRGRQWLRHGGDRLQHRRKRRGGKIKLISADQVSPFPRPLASILAKAPTPLPYIKPHTLHDENHIRVEILASKCFHFHIL
jgi:hypothetical protein